MNTSYRLSVPIVLLVAAMQSLRARDTARLTVIGGSVGAERFGMNTIHFTAPTP